MPFDLIKGVVSKENFAPPSLIPSLFLRAQNLLLSPFYIFANRPRIIKCESQWRYVFNLKFKPRFLYF